MRIVFMGTPEFAVAPLEILMLNRAEVVAVYTQPDRAAGRGRVLVAPPVKTIAQKWGLPVYQPQTLKSGEEREALAALKPDVVVVAAFGQIFTQAVLELPARGFLNIHPSLLPLYRGVSPVPVAILNGDAFTGVSIMLLDRGVDTGPILAQAAVAITDWDTTGTLTEKLSRIGGQMLLEVLPRWVRGDIAPRAQGPAAASYTRMITKQDGEIDWTRPAIDVWRRVRAYQPWPAGYTRWQGKQVKIIEAAVVPGQTDKPGRVVPLVGETAFGVETGSGILGVVRLQVEGKRVMTSGEFLRGQRQFVGALLTGERER
jgi:methionyl-tRNA formyltransferase